MRWLLLVISLLFSVMAQAATTAVIPLNVNVQPTMEISAVAFMQLPGQKEPDTSVVYGGMDFGKLRWNSQNGWYAPDISFCVFLFTNVNTGSYNVVQQTDSLVFSGSTSDLSKKIIVTPGFCGADEWKWTGGSGAQGDIISGDYCGGEGTGGMHSTMFTANGKTFHSYTARPRVANLKQTIFVSTSGSSQIIRAYYGFYTADPDMKKEWGLPMGYNDDRDGLVTDTDLVGINFGSGPATVKGQVTFTLTHI